MNKMRKEAHYKRICNVNPVTSQTPAFRDTHPGAKAITLKGGVHNNQTEVAFGERL